MTPKIIISDSTKDTADRYSFPIKKVTEEVLQEFFFGARTLFIVQSRR